jgi:hypothetical protein
MRAYNEGVRLYAVMWEALLVLSFIRRVHDTIS